MSDMRAVIPQFLPLIASERERRNHRRDPVNWVRTRLNEFTWSKQNQILESVRDNRRTAVHSCHESGKSWLAARIAAWWLDVWPVGEAFVVSSAPTGRQVRAILWKEIGRAHAKGLRGRMNQTEWFMTGPNGKEELVAFGMKPSDTDPAAFQGIHARRVLVIFDEACGIPGGSGDNPHSLWEAADSLIANDESRFLCIGNPDDPSSEFHEVCKPGSGWNVMGIDAYETPNFTGEKIPLRLRDLLIGKTWVEEKRHKWGETNPMWIAKVRGQFPIVSTDGLIPMSWVKAAQDRTLPASDPVELGVDVGGGGDKNVVALRRGPHVRIIRRDQVPDTMQSCGNLVHDLSKTKATLAKVDEIGIGRGLVDRAKEQGLPVEGVNVGREPKNKEAFVNIRAEAYWGLRERFQDGQIDIDPNDDDLAAQLVDLKFKRSSSGKILIESKDEIKRRGKGSPDEADAVMLAFLPSNMYGVQPVRTVPFTLG